MSDSKTDPLKLARQGNCSAIDSLINHQLRSRNITSKSIFQNGCLRIFLDSEEAPDQAKLVPYLQKGIVGLKIDSLTSIEISGRCKYSSEVAWKETIKLDQTATKEQHLGTAPIPQEDSKDEDDSIYPIEMKGTNGVLIVKKEKVVLVRKGGFLSTYKKGQKEIKYSDILSFQYSPPEGFTADGFIYFQLPGNPLTIKKGDSLFHENSVSFANANPGKLGSEILPKIHSVLLRKLSSTLPQTIYQIEEEGTKIFEIKGYSGDLIVEEDKIVIAREGGFLKLHKKGRKEFLFSEIISFQYLPQKGDNLSFFYFQLIGNVPKVSINEAIAHENAVCFSHSIKEEFLDLQKRIHSLLSHKITSSEGLNNCFIGENGSLIIDDEYITIHRIKSLTAPTLGDKNIPYRSISAIQFENSEKSPLGHTLGFIQFSIQGGVERQGGIVRAMTDENTITFKTEEKNSEFVKAQRIIEAKIVELNNPSSRENNQPFSSSLDYLEKLASLKEKGIITEEEFQTKKKQVLEM